MTSAHNCGCSANTRAAASFVFWRRSSSSAKRLTVAMRCCFSSRSNAAKLRQSSFGAASSEPDSTTHQHGAPSSAGRSPVSFFHEPPPSVPGSSRKALMALGSCAPMQHRSNFLAASSYISLLWCSAKSISFATATCRTDQHTYLPCRRHKCTGVSCKSRPPFGTASRNCGLSPSSAIPL